MSIPWTSGEVLNEHIRSVPPEIVEEGNAEKIIFQLRENRHHALKAWLSYNANGLSESERHTDRFVGDTGKVLKLAEHPFWKSEEQKAEQERFEELDAAYEAAKTFYGV